LEGGGGGALEVEEERSAGWDGGRRMPAQPK